MMNEMYCVYCSRLFLAANSLIAIVNRTTGERETINERGYQTIRMVAKKLEENADSYLLMNQEYVESKMRAETLINGNAVCMDHMSTADMNQRPAWLR